MRNRKTGGCPLGALIPGGRSAASRHVAAVLLPCGPHPLWTRGPLLFVTPNLGKKAARQERLEANRALACAVCEPIDDSEAA